MYYSTPLTVLLRYVFTPYIKFDYNLPISLPLVPSSYTDSGEFCVSEAFVFPRKFEESNCNNLVYTPE
jgi:hypothetical protein